MTIEPATDEQFDRDHHGVYALFVKFARQVKERGKRRFSSDAILHRIRWWEQIDRGNGEFKCNDHWTSYLSRRLMREMPEEFGGFFETRRLRAGEADQEQAA